MTTTPAVDRARSYVAVIPGAVSGNSGHDQTFAVACKLVEFGLSPSEAWGLLLEYNERCQPPWSERELQHKFTDAFRHARPRYDFKTRPLNFPPKAKATIDPTTGVENFLRGFRCTEVDLWESSPVRPPDDWTKDGLTLIECLYRPGERINFVTDFVLDEDRKAKPMGRGETIERDALIARWRKAGTPSSEAGGWLRMNPVDSNGVSDANVTAFRFALLESDKLPVDLALSLFCKLPLPIAAILSSGGRSLHAWVRVDVGSVDEYRATVARLLLLLARFGIDPKNKNPSRLSRLPGIVRRIGAQRDGRQRLLYLDPQPQQKAIL